MSDCLIVSAVEEVMLRVFNTVVKLGLKPRGRSHKPFWIPIYTRQDDTTD